MSEPALTEARYALIVAVSQNKYKQLPELQAPAEDAKRLSAVLEDPDIGGFQVEVAANPGAEELRERIEEFFTKKSPNDLLLIHFSCHGVTDASGKLYLVASDTDVENKLHATGIAAEWIREQIADSRPTRIVMLLDCCFSGLFPSGLSPRGGNQVSVPTQVGSGAGRLVITASNAIQPSLEPVGLGSERQPSIFTSAVVEALASGEADRDGDNQVSVHELYDYVFKRVKERTPHQTPTTSGELEGAVYIARTPPSKVGTSLLRLEPDDYIALKPICHLDGRGSEIFSLAFAPSSKLLAAGTNGAILVWSSEAELRDWGHQPPDRRVIPVKGTYIYSVAISPSGDLLAAAGEDGIVRMYRLPSRKPLWQGEEHKEAVYSVDFEPHGTMLASGGYDRQVCIWQVSSGHMQRKWDKFPSRISSVAFSPDRDTSLLAIGSHDNNVWLWKWRVGEPEPLEPLDCPHGSSVEAVAFAPPDGALLASVGLDKAVIVWDVSKRARRWRNNTEHEYLVRSVAFAPGGLTIASASWDKTIRLWNSGPEGEPVQMPNRKGEEWAKHTDWIWSVRFNHDGSALATAGSDDKVVIWALPVGNS